MTAVDELFLSKLRDLPKQCAFRGQQNSDWKLHSAATRRLIKHYNCDEDFTRTAHFSQAYVLYHRAILLQPAHTYGFGIDDGFSISPIQILAKLQHFGAATGLIDFTRDPLIALWFACESLQDIQGNEGNGRVFVIDLGDASRFERLTSDKESQTAEEILSPATDSRKILYWEPMIQGEATSRVLRQQSVFVIDRPEIPYGFVTSIAISATDKAKLLEELETILNVNRRTLFTDIQGFSAVNGAGSPIETLEIPVNYLIQGIHYHRQGNFQSAIDSADKCIELDGDASEPYIFRGNAKTILGDYEGAEIDFGMAIRHKERPFLNWDRGRHRIHDYVFSWVFYFNRGNARSAQADYKGALTDYDYAIRLHKQLGDASSTLFFNRGNARFMLQNFEDAVVDFSEAAERGYKNALINKGNALVLLGRFEEAIRCYDEAFEDEGTQSGYSGNREWARLILEKVNGKEYEVQIASPGEFLGLLTVDVIADSLVESETSDSLVFKGNVGSAGNNGFNQSQGTKGYPGLMGFVVRI